ncbi:DUF6443 domain-containing protein [Chryseobacterium sp. MMS23-Vi53]|uniref:DUF6443 domain-containing protein n=1 Tax=Chryseobacterium sp. MMS23-Vi53 TaxID=3386644 RepID=UPI0039EB5F16
MKKIIISISALFITGLAKAQLSTAENYIYTKTYLNHLDPSDPTQILKVSETVQYFDGLGRPKQIVNIQATPQGKDVVTHIEYDGFGRQVKDFLPVPQQGTQNGGIYASPLSNATQPTLYGSEKIFSEKQLENSPLDRILSQKQVGNAWDNKPVTFGYDANVDGDVKKYIATFDYTNFESHIILSGSYATGQLYKNIVTDEDENQTIEFKNGQGQVLLVRKVGDTGNIDTYYVYNDYNQLAYVIPPLASVTGLVDETTLNNLCYQYKYDGRNRLVEKKLPGKGKEYMVYDKQDRLVLTRDANMESKGQWLFTKYDQFSRPIYTGILDSPPGREAQVVAVEGQGSNNELRSSSSFNNAGMDVYYSNTTAYPTANFKLLSVNYYDTYPTGSPNISSPILQQEILPQADQGVSVSTKGLPTASYVKNIEDDNWTKNYTWYDIKGRAISTYSINHLGGRTKMDSKLDFAGVVQKTITTHKRLDTDTDRVIIENFTYDSQNRLLAYTHQVDNNFVETISENSYNELSQLTNKKVGGYPSLGGNSFLQSIDYSYNIRGWMTKINDPKNLNGKLFGYEMKYDSVDGEETPDPFDTSLKVLPRYNGNITEVDWKTSTSPNDYLRRYGYVYDKLNRLSAGFYQREDNPSAREYFEKMTYDLNGNITNLKRTASLDGNTTAGLIDNLSYEYFNNDQSNRLNKITDGQQNPSGYPLGGNIIEYDNNGNMTNHLDKGINLINYNFLNLPDSVRRGSGRLIQSTNYLYRADGVKVKKTRLSQSVILGYTEYLDGFQYEKTGNFAPSLQFVPTSEGYYDFQQNKYIYNYLDHLGNVRVSYTKNGLGIDIVEESNYYPFGLKHEGYNMLSGNPSYQYKYNGKELQTETGMYDYGARFYMPDLGRWGVIDPLAEKHRRYSPYNYAVNNPIRFIDPDGRDISYTGADAQAAFRLLQSFMGSQRPPNDYIFDEKGNYVRTEKNNQPHRLVVENSKTKSRTNYSFADPSEDPKQIDRGIINKLLFVSEAEIEGMLKGQGTFESGKFNFAWESQGGGDFDYSYSVLPKKYTEASSDPLTNYSNALFLPEGDNTAHNQMNFGNYLWGATGYTVGFDYSGLQMGAHANSRFNSRRNGYDSQWDSKDDQRSIILGATHARRGGYRSIKAIMLYGKTHKNSY